MAVYKNDTEIASYPAFKVYRRKANRHGCINLTAWENLALRGHLGTYRIGSVASAALEDNECPLEAIERCQQQIIDHPHAGHRLHWINQNPSGLSDMKQPQVKVIEVRVGMLVKFEGNIFTITREANDNLGLKFECTASDLRSIRDTPFAVYAAECQAKS